MLITFHFTFYYFLFVRTHFCYLIRPPYPHQRGLLGGSVVKNPPANAGNAGDATLIPGLGRSPEVVNGNPLQYSCLGNLMDRGAWVGGWGVAIHGITKSRTQLSNRACTHPHQSYSKCFRSSQAFLIGLLK